MELFLVTEKKKKNSKTPPHISIYSELLIYHVAKERDKY